MNKPYHSIKYDFLAEGTFLDKHWNEACVDGGIYTGYNDTGFRLKVKRR